MSRLIQLFQSIVTFRRPLIIAFNLAVTLIGYLLALGLRFDFAPEEILVVERLYLPASLLLVFRFLSYTYWNLNRGYWRYTSTRDAVLILKAHAASSLAFAASILLLRIPAFPRSVLFTEFLLSLLLSGGGRLLVRIFTERLVDARAGQRDRERVRQVLVLGGGDSGHLLVKYLLSAPRLPYRVVGILDDSERLQGGQVHGVPVVGRISDLGLRLREFPRVSAVIVAIPSLSADRIRYVSQVCSALGIAVKRLQSFEDIACIDADQVPTAASVESVLEKEMHIEHEAEIRAALKEKRILITGAGGSIGSEIVRQVLSFKPAALILLDNGEYNLFRIDREVAGLAPEVSRRAVLTSITDENHLRQVFVEEKPEIVFHAAAFKHVPLVEENALAAIHNNIFGSLNVLRAAYETGVGRFVMISSDKAVAPSSLMGATKRIAEMLVEWFAQFSEPHVAQGQRLFTPAVVRFGNVINSNGSVVPLFREQILSGGPVTVTHPEMERFFMSVREAVRLVLTAGILGERGEVYILDMGKPIRIVDVARKMMALYGRRDVEIIYTGLRPGEKLSEVLIDEHDRLADTPFRKVRRREHPVAPERNLLEWIESLRERLPQMTNEEMRNEVFGYLGRCRLIDQYAGDAVARGRAV